MSQTLKAGSRWKSAVCDTEAVVVRPPSSAVALECGGAPMLAITESRPQGAAPAPAFAEGSLLGKRYSDEVSGLEMLCTKPGLGSLAVDGRLLLLKEAKRLPSSD
jgi:hypothetical protein